MKRLKHYEINVILSGKTIFFIRGIKGKKMKKERKILTIGAFDLAKGVGMLCIIVGHTMHHYNLPIMGLYIMIRILGISMMPMFF